jgi:hypothetical protein
VDYILAGLLYLLTVFVLGDLLLVYLVQTYKPLLKNKYFGFHKRYGFLKVSALKSICALFFVYLLLEPSPNAGKLTAPIIAHGFLVTKLLFDFITKEG